MKTDWKTTLWALFLLFGLAACSDDEEEQGETYSIEGTWLLQSSKGYIENSNDKQRIPPAAYTSPPRRIGRLPSFPSLPGPREAVRWTGCR